ncbi:MAG: flagellar hook-length control protein FliK [Oscillospiraceae bacterium]
MNNVNDLMQISVGANRNKATSKTSESKKPDVSFEKTLEQQLKSENFPTDKPKNESQGEELELKDEKDEDKNEENTKPDENLLGAVVQMQMSAKPIENEDLQLLQGGKIAEPVEGTSEKSSLETTLTKTQSQIATGTQVKTDNAIQPETKSQPQTETKPEPELEPIVSGKNEQNQAVENNTNSNMNVQEAQNENANIHAVEILEDTQAVSQGKLNDKSENKTVNPIKSSVVSEDKINQLNVEIKKVGENPLINEKKIETDQPQSAFEIKPKNDTDKSEKPVLTNVSDDTKAKEDKTVNLDEKSSQETKKPLKEEKILIKNEFSTNYLLSNSERLAQSLNQKQTAIGDKIPFTGEEMKQIETADVPAQITKAIDFGKNEGISEFEIKLEPEFLGKMTVKMVIENQRLSVEFVAQTQKGEMALKENMGMLETALKSQFVQVDRINVTYDSFNNLNSSNGQQNSFTFNQSNSQNHNNQNHSQGNNLKSNSSEENVQIIDDTLIKLKQMSILNYKI